MHRIKFISLAWLLIISFLIQGSFNSIVLCIENDGNIEIESSYNGECITALNQIPAKRHKTVLLSASYEQDEHCDSCLDLPLTISNPDHQSFLISPVSHLQISMPLLPTISQEYPVSQSIMVDLPPVETIYQTNNILASIRTIIFLI